MIKTVILDFDGTMADTRGVIVKTLHQTIDTIGVAQPSDDECAATIGLPLATAFSQLLSVSTEEGERCAATYRRLFEENNTPDAVPLFPHVADTIKALTRGGVTVTIASSRGHQSIEGFLDRFGLTPFISLILGADDVEKAKPYPEPVLQTLRYLHADAAETLVVGDTEYDIVMGKRACAQTCGVTYGNGTRQQMERCGANHIIDDFARLVEITLPDGRKTPLR